MTARRDRKRKGSPQWVRLGELLAARRAELDPAYFDRGAFAQARGINLKLAQDIENNGRENFTPLTLRDVIAPAYGVEYQSILSALDGGDLAAAPGTPPRRQPRSAEPRDLPRASPEMAIAMADRVAAFEDLAQAARAAHPGERLSGTMVFPAGMPDAIWYWNEFAARGYAEDRLPSMVAGAMTLDEQKAVRDGRATGLAGRHDQDTAYTSGAR